MELLDDYWGAFYWGLQHVLGKVIFTPYSGNLPKADYYLMAVRYMKEKEDRIRHYFHEPSLAPSQELFNMVQNLRDTNQWTKQNFEEFFRPSFLDQVWQEPMASSINDLVRMINDGHTVCVMCYCRDLSKCHLSILAEVFVDTLGCSGQVELHYNGLVINSRLSERLKEMKKGLK
jgi:uncharacterized protein YeaO (DUF488 family)